ncbi:MAG: hypothetical protein Q7S27_04790 [Nanoarchaeota archaeon]|nr:hypothetical protein [Nanoarchaeota archaeon]
MTYEIYDINGLNVHTGNLPTNPEHLDSLRRVTSTVVDIYFCKRTRDGVEEKTPYDTRSITGNKSGLGITIRDQTSGEIATLHVGSLDKVTRVLNALEVRPESLASAVGKEVNAYKDAIALYGIWVPTFARERRIA